MPRLLSLINPAKEIPPRTTVPGLAKLPKPLTVLACFYAPDRVGVRRNFTKFPACSSPHSGEIETDAVFSPAPLENSGFRDDFRETGVYRSGQTGQTVNLMALPS